MKRFLNLIILLAYTLVSLAQESEPNAMYVYRNDGDFNAFFFSEVDSLTYSQYGEDSVLYDDMEVQVIWTRDSIYRIHTDVIDSISFTKPETKLQSDVVVMDANWLPYVINADGMNITFNPDIVNLWQPKAGDVLVYMNFDDTFPDGFAGRVITIENENNVILVICEEVSIEDIYESLIILENNISEDNFQPSIKRAPKDGGEVSLTNTYNVAYTFTQGNLTSTLSSSVSLSVRVFVSMGKNLPFKLEFSLSDKETISLISEITKEVNDDKIKTNKPSIMVSIPITANGVPTGFQAFIDIWPCLEYGFSGKYQSEISGNTETTTTVSFYDNSWHFNKPVRTSNIQPKLTVSAKGYVGIGLETDLGLRYVGNIIRTNLAVTGTLGLKTDSELDFLQTESVAYNIFKDAHVDAYAKAEYDFGWHLKIPYTGIELNGEKPIMKPSEKILKEWYLFPEFSEIKCEGDEGQKLLSTKVTRDVLIPVTTGFRAYNGGKKGEKYMETTYHSGSTNMSIDAAQLNIQPNETYTVMPIVKLVNIVVEATPQATIRTTEIKDEPCLESEDENAVFFKKPSNWSSTIYCYLSDEYSGSWPGILATSIGNDYYKVVLNSSVPPEGNLIIWNVGGSQCTGDAQTNDLSFKNRSLYVINGSATNPNYSSGMNLSEVEDCLVSPTLPTCSTSKVTKICYDCECNQR